MKTHTYARLAALALLLTVALPMRADAREHWWHHHHVPIPAYTALPAYRVAPSYMTVPSMHPYYASVPSYGVVPSVVPSYTAYPYHLSKHQIAELNHIGRMERYAASHPVY
ncbi:MAG: hypothetical protein ACLQU2_27240 [Candidatus Binataceae bacterium]